MVYNTGSVRFDTMLMIRHYLMMLLRPFFYASRRAIFYIDDAYRAMPPRSPHAATLADICRFSLIAILLMFRLLVTPLPPHTLMITMFH